MPRLAVSHRALYIVVGGLALAAPPLLLRAAPDNWNDVQQAVAAMPQTERDRLNRNIQEYETLSDEQREQYRRLHAALQDDADNKSGKLNATMEGYYAWLGSNPAYDRQTLRNETDSNRRLAEVERIVRQRDEQASRWRTWRSRRFLQDAPDLTPDQLAMLMGKLEDRLSLTPEDRKRMQADDGSEKTGVARYFTLFSIMGHHKRKLDQLLEPPLDLDAIVAEIPGLTMPPEFPTAPAEFRRFLFLQMIVGNVLKEYENEVRRQQPTTEKLEELVAHWPEDRKDDLDRWLELEPSDFRSNLEREYAKQSNSLDMKDLWEVFPDRGGRGMFPRFNGPDGGRGGFFRGGRPGDGPFGRGDRFERPDGPPPAGPPPGGEFGGPPPDGSGGPPRGDRGPRQDGERGPRREGDRGPAPVNPPPKL
ncbi:MAG: hypothetical protein U0992_12825 [Planctomycetaceae bacterium]